MLFTPNVPIKQVNRLKKKIVDPLKKRIHRTCDILLANLTKNVVIFVFFKSMAFVTVSHFYPRMIIYNPLQARQRAYVKRGVP